MPLEGEHIRLREEREGDMQVFAALRNDLETQAWSKTLPPDYTIGMYQKRFEAREFSFDPREGRFTIEERESGDVVGSISYTSLEKRWSATIGIVVAKPFWGSGYAYEAQELLLRFLFQELGLRVVRLWTHSGIPRAVGLAEKGGFKIGFRQRESIYKDGQLFDNLLMDMLREEYFERHPEEEDRLPKL